MCGNEVLYEISSGIKKQTNLEDLYNPMPRFRIHHSSQIKYWQ